MAAGYGSSFVVMFKLIRFVFPYAPGRLIVRTHPRPAQVSCDIFPTILLLYVYLVQGRTSDRGDSRIIMGNIWRFFASFGECIYFVGTLLSSSSA